MWVATVAEFRDLYRKRL